MKQGTLANLLSGLLVTCALVIVALVIRHEFFAPTPSNPVVYATPQRIQGWRDLAAVGHVLGSKQAPVKIVEFADFQCPYCRELDATFQRLLAKHAKHVAIVYRHFPLPPSMHPFAHAAAIASECAAAQGRFAAYHDVLFEEQDSIGAISWERFAQIAGVPDMARFRACLTGPEAAQRVAEDVSAAKRFAVSGTPTIIIGDRLATGAVPLDTLEAWIRRYAPKGAAPR